MTEKIKKARLILADEKERINRRFSEAMKELQHLQNHGKYNSRDMATICAKLSEIAAKNEVLCEQERMLKYFES